MQGIQLFDRLLDVIEYNIVPKTRAEVVTGSKIFGAAVLRKADLSLQGVELLQRKELNGMRADMDLAREEECYRSCYYLYGYSHKALRWSKDIQHIRFDILTSQYNFKGKSVLDIGCGFGDLNKILKKFSPYRYLGVDLVNEFINEGNVRFGSDSIRFEHGDFLEKEFNIKIDYAIASGIFNHKFVHCDNYEFIEFVMTKAFDLVCDGLAFDFLSDKATHQYEDLFYSSPDEILKMAYKKTKNVILRNDYMPFDFSIFLFKDDSFSDEDTLFNHYKKRDG